MAITPYLTISINGCLILGGDEPYPHLDLYNHESEVSIHSYPEVEPGLVTILI
jgi:hypothetical protein